MAWTATDAQKAWSSVYQKFMLKTTGPSRNDKVPKAMESVANQWHLFKQRSLLDGYGRAKLVVAGAGKVLGLLKIADAVLAPIGALLDFGLGKKQAEEVERAIGKIDGDESARRNALARQMADSQAADFFAEMVRLRAAMDRLAKITKIDGCADLDSAMTHYGEARYRNNTLSKHVAYMEALASKGRQVIQATQAELDKKEKEIEQIGLDAFASAEWHEANCGSKRHCLFPWDEHERKKGDISLPVSSSLTPADVARMYPKGNVVKAGPPPLPPKPGLPKR